MIRHIYLVVALTAAIALTGQQVDAAKNNGSVSIKFAGEKNWSATCTFVKTNGKERTITRRGRGSSSIESLAMRNIDSGNCTLEVPTDTQVKVTFNSKGTISCPFDNSEPCMHVVAAGGAKTFSF